MTEVFETLGLIVRPQSDVVRVRHIIAMKQMRANVTKEEHAAAVVEQRKQSQRTVYPLVGEGLVDPDEIKSLPGKFQVALADKKPMSVFRKGKA